MNAKSLLFLLIISSTLFGSNIDKFASYMGYYRDYNEALNKAKEENKILFIVQVGDYCSWCRKLERKTLQNSIVAVKINQNFISLIIDRNIDKGRYPNALYSKRVPNIYFIDSRNEKIIKEVAGYKTKNDFIIILDNFLSKHKAIK